ncbi:MAG TPA: hypothetical protein VN924_16700 [Bryobacteraceae bacterium]|nr:hypothetical protein [Bryobacteraceae bacterium]
MFTWICPHCGREVPPSYDACPDCAAREQAGGQPAQTRTEPVPVATAPPAIAGGSRVASHLRLVMVLWLAQGGLRLSSMIPGLFLWFPVGMLPLGAVGFTHLERPLSGVGWAFLLVTTTWTVACLVVAWGLLERKPWARIYTIVVSAIWLLDFPLGTALSIYTLWVLLPESSEAEYRRLAMP